ncbi:RraA family protein [Jiangella sp. DSM 45060]|uniref:RraA family protein n=1 Tax=Jiangella sp. DSM 45060 TaxID=1798224 RepID=UPI00087B38D6|nr:RraA family protein [Jiangella sp. DSM 45060]SDS45423.1 Regulator of RNase E activity RraA [Jiangella sp. DSM 45060]
MTGIYDYDVPVLDLVKRYQNLYSGAVYDVLDEMGLPHQALATDLKPVLPTMVVAGPAFTMKGIPDSAGNPELRARRIHMFTDMKATGVPLIDVRDCSFDMQAAHYGEMNATVGKSCGVVGAVIDGGCRDTAFLIRDEFPVFCRYQSPVEAYRRWSYYEWQQPVALRGALTAVVPVNPGDFVCGDLDGVVIVPKDVVVEVLEKTEDLVERENGVRAEFVSGGDPVEIYQRHGRL